MRRTQREYSKHIEREGCRSTNSGSLVNAGRASSEQPKRFYKFALIDPVDQPFATFRYYYRTWSQLRELGVDKQECRGEGEENDMSVIEPYEDSARDDETMSGSRAASRDAEDSQLHSPTKRITRRRSPVETMKPTTAKTSQPSAGASEQPRAYVPRGAPLMRPSSRIHRLSVPPSIRLCPPGDTSRPLPKTPHKSDSQSSIAYRPHPAYPMDEWRERTPSPVKSIREGLSTPPLEKRRGGSRASSLMNAISSTWRRRGTPSSESHRGGEGRHGARSTST